jgi:Hydrazine synthase alpha subunit middle domain
VRIRQVASGTLLLAALALRGHVSASSEPGATPLLYTVAKEYEPLAWLRSQERFPLGAQIFAQSGNERHPLVNGFAATADPAVSYDGTHVLFAGKQKANDPWRIYEIAAKGGEPRQIVSCEEDCVRPFYLPADRFVYARKAHGHFTIEAAPLAGGKPLPLTYAPGNFLPTDVLRDGRVLFEGTFPGDSGSVPEIYTVYSDGSGVESYRCDHGHARYAGRQLYSGDIVFTSDRGLSRFTSALAQELQVPAPAGEYAGDIVEMPSGTWLLAWRASPRGRFQLKRWKPGLNTLEAVAGGAGDDFIQPALLAPRPIPNRHPSALHDWTYANLLCLNVYTSKYSFAEGAVSAVRLHTQDPSGQEKMLGTAAVESDGSFYLRTPADQPLKIALLDRAGKTLKKEAGWFWLRRGEQRVCVGCHAGPETAPENAVPAVLLRSTIPADMTGATTVSSKGAH